MSALPTQVLFMWTYEDRAELWFDFETVFDARDFCKKAKEHWMGMGTWVKITDWRVHPPTGEFRVVFTFEKNTSPDDMFALLGQPPCSNRGVTNSNQEEK